MACFALNCGVHVCACMCGWLYLLGLHRHSRAVLIFDVERPKELPLGEAKGPMTTELDAFIDYFRTCCRPQTELVALLLLSGCSSL